MTRAPLLLLPLLATMTASALPLSDADIEAAHPRPQDPGPLYHDADHSRCAARIAERLARARKLPDPEVRFFTEVALLHDWDPARKAAAPPRVPATLEALALDWERKRPLIPGLPPALSVLRDRLGWSESHLRRVRALIQRTEHPFAESHPDPAYGKSSPVKRYEEAIAKLPVKERLFVLEWAPLLAEWADKAGFYLTDPYPASIGRLVGLARELSREPKSFDTVRFLASIGSEESLALDRAIAKRLGVAVRFATREEVLALLPAEMRRTLEENRAGFESYQQGLMPKP